MQIEIHSYKDIGQVLRDVRISMRLDPRDIAAQLHIRAKYLTALEDGDIDSMPGKVYARGYLRQYAAFLGLSADEISEAFDRVSTGTRNVKYFVPEPTSTHYQPGMLVVGIALVAVLFVYIYWYNTHSTISAPEHEMVSPVPERLLAPVVKPEPQSDAASTPVPAAVPAEPDGSAMIGPKPFQGPPVAVRRKSSETPAQRFNRKRVDDTPWRDKPKKAAP